MPALDFGSMDRFERIAALGLASMHPGGDLATRQLADWTNLPPRVGPGGGVHVLDVGCGVGKTTCWLAANRQVTITGLDRSGRMVGRARERAAAANLEIAFVEGDAYDLPFADGTFDVVFAESVTLFLDRARVLEQIHRVLVPGGKVADIVMTCHEPVPPGVLDDMAALEGVRMYPVSEAEWRADYTNAGFTLPHTEFHASLSNRGTAFAFFRDNGLGGVRAMARMAGHWIKDPAVRGYTRDLGRLWKANQHRFGYGLIVAEKPPV